MVKGRGMLKGRGNEKEKGDGEGKGDGEKGDGEKGDGEKGRGMEKRRGMVKGRAYLGPCRHLLMVLDPRRCLCACVPVVSSLGHVASLSSHVLSLCRHWAVLPHCHRHVSGHVVVVPCAPRRIIVLSWSHRCAVSSSLPSCVIIVPRRRSVVVQCLSKVCWEEQGMGVTHHGLLTTTMNDDIVCHLVAMSPSAMWHLDPVSEKWMGGGELSHLGSSLPVSVHRCWLL